MICARPAALSLPDGGTRHHQTQDILIVGGRWWCALHLRHLSLAAIVLVVVVRDGPSSLLIATTYTTVLLHPIQCTIVVGH